MSLSANVHIGGSLALRDKLVAITCEYLYQVALVEYELDPSIPSPLVSGVTYYTIPCTADLCVDMPCESPTAMRARGTADCKSIAAWRRAYLKVKYGIDTVFDISRRVLPSGDVEYHIKIQGVGRHRHIAEDPSVFLGMGRTG